MIDLKSLYGGDLNLLTGRQRDVLQLILESVIKSGTTPTLRQLMASLGIQSPNGINCHLVALIRKDFLEPLDGKRIALKGLRFVPVREGA